MLLRPTLAGVGAVAVSAVVVLSATPRVTSTSGGDARTPMALLAPDPAVQSCCPYYPYDGSMRFVRIQTSSRYGRYGRGGWSHDYPASDTNMSTILRELTLIRTRELAMGGNVLTFDDPRLMQFPIAYVSEPGDWTVSDTEADGLRTYLLKGGFVMFDDFFARDMSNVIDQMSYVLPELHWQRLDGTEPIWDSFYRLEPLSIYLEGPRKYGAPEFWGLFEDDDPNKRMMGIANAGADVGDLWEWAAEGWYPVDPTNEAFRIGVNYFIYAMTH